MEKLTVVIFKNQLTSRTFEVSRKNLERIGISFVVVIFLAFFSSLFFIRTGVQMIKNKENNNSERIPELEKQLGELKSSYESLQAHLAGTTKNGGSSPQSSLRSILFTSIPNDSLRSPVPSRETLPFRLDSMKAHWQGNFLLVSSSIEYTKGDEGSQQGNFFILAQGPQNLYAHPEGAFSDPGSETLLDPESGEYFSVARFREIRARFGPVERKDQIQSLTIYIFDRNKNLIYLDRLSLKESLNTKKTDSNSAPLSPKPSETKSTPDEPEADSEGATE